MLGDTRGLDILELGCGAAQWSVALAALGANITGLDLSASQLRHARDASATLPLVLASGEQLPIAPGAFDLVFCDHGAMSFCNPDVIVPEVARVLRPNGRLVFCATHPLLYLTYDAGKDRQTRRLEMEYAQLGRMDLGEGTIDWAPPPSGWIRTLRTHDFEVLDCIELIAGPSATTTYEDFAPAKWARKWPAEWIWSARRA